MAVTAGPLHSVTKTRLRQRAVNMGLGISGRYPKAGEPRHMAYIYPLALLYQDAAELITAYCADPERWAAYPEVVSLHEGTTVACLVHWRDVRRWLDEYGPSSYP